MKDLHTENYKTLIKETEANSKKWKDTPCSSIGSVNIITNDHTTQSNLEQEQSWTHKLLRHQAILQSYSNQNSEVLANK